MLLSDLSAKTGQSIPDLIEVCKLFDLKIEGLGANQKLAPDTLNAVMTIVNGYKEKGEGKSLPEYAKDVLSHLKASASARSSNSEMPNVSQVLKDLAGRKGHEQLFQEKLNNLHEQARSSAVEEATLLQVLKEFYATDESVVNCKPVKAIQAAAQQARRQGFFDEDAFIKGVDELSGEIPGYSANFTNALIQGSDGGNQGTDIPRQYKTSRILSGGNTK